MMQLYPCAIERLSLDELREAAEWAVRLAAMIGPDEPTARGVLLRLSGALVDSYEAAVRATYGLPARDFFAGAGDDA